MGYSPWGCKESATKQTHTELSSNPTLSSTIQAHNLEKFPQINTPSLRLFWLTFWKVWSSVPHCRGPRWPLVTKKGGIMSSSRDSSGPHSQVYQSASPCPGSLGQLSQDPGHSPCLHFPAISLPDHSDNTTVLPLPGMWLLLRSQPGLSHPPPRRLPADSPPPHLNYLASPPTKPRACPLLLPHLASYHPPHVA